MSSGVAALGVPQFNTPIDAVQVVEQIITPAQFKAMNGNTNTSVVLVPAPGPNALIEVIECSVNLQFIAPAYATGTSVLALGVDSGGVVAAIWGDTAQGIMNAGVSGLKGTSSTYYSVRQTTALGPGGIATSQIANKALLVNLKDANQYTAGNSNIRVTVRYRIVPVA